MNSIKIVLNATSPVIHIVILNLKYQQNSLIIYNVLKRIVLYLIIYETIETSN